MNILATGGAGYVGSGAVRYLLGQGFDVSVYDNLATGHRGAVPAQCLIEGDLADSARLREVLRDRKIDAVMHFAGSIAVGESVENPRLYYRNNVLNSLKLLEAMLDESVERILFSSTAAVYAPVSEGSLTEDSAKEPDSPYAFSKYAIERLIKDFSRAYGLGYAILRYFNACGASPDGKYGEDHDPETHLIPLVLQVGLGKRDKIGIFGNDYDTPDGTCIRDYIHVDDLADAHARAVGAIKPCQGNVYNIGTGSGNSVLEVLEAAEEVIGREIAREFLPRRPGDTTRLVAGAEKLRVELGWEPKYNNVRDIIETAWRWHLEHPDGY